MEDSKACSMKSIREDDLQRVFMTMMNKLRFGNDLVLKPLLIAITTRNSRKNSYSLQNIEEEMKNNITQREQLASLLSKGTLERPIFIQAHNKLMMEYEHLEGEHELLLRMDVLATRWSRHSMN